VGGAAAFFCAGGGNRHPQCRCERGPTARGGPAPHSERMPRPPRRAAGPHLHHHHHTEAGLSDAAVLQARLVLQNLQQGWKLGWDDAHEWQSAAEGRVQGCKAADGSSEVKPTLPW
jgi:hypothetical protein